MDIRNALKETAAHLFGVKSNQVQIQLNQPSSSSFGFISCILSIEVSGSQFLGGGSSTQTMKAFAKAVSEVGESILMSKLNLKSRNGLAGGLLSSAAVNRAKCELIERDSFLFHYRNRKPFYDSKVIGSSTEEKLRVFSLYSKDDTVKVSLATTDKCARGESECLIFGVGAGHNSSIAEQKAIEEFSSFYDFHIKQPGWCKNLRPETANLPEKHHLYSKDSRNIELFKLLCKSDGLREVGQLSIQWRTEYLTSPVKYFRFCYVESPDLTKMEFGVPESSLEPSIFHPFW